MAETGHRVQLDGLPRGHLDRRWVPRPNRRGAHQQWPAGARRRMRVVHVANHPLPYHTPILAALDALVDLHVVYMSSAHPLGSFDDLWGTAPSFSHETYWSVPLRWRRGDFRAQVSVGVALRLRKLEPQTILFNSWTPLVLEPLVWRLVGRRRAVMWSESTRFSGHLRGPISNRLRRAVVSRVDAIVAESTSATEYLLDLGADASKVVTSCLPSPLQPVATGDTEGDGRSGSRPRYLFVGRLIPQKRPLELIDAFRVVADELPEATLTVVGDGILGPEVARRARRMAGRIVVLPRLEGARLSRVYAAADILVLPSVREGWGLVVNEGLAHGLYVIATDQVTSALDLLADETGVIVPADDRRALVDAMVAAGRNAPLNGSARRRRRRSIEHCTPAAFANDVYRAIQIAWGER